MSSLIKRDKSSTYESMKMCCDDNRICRNSNWMPVFAVGIVKYMWHLYVVLLKSGHLVVKATQESFSSSTATPSLVLPSASICAFLGLLSLRGSGFSVLHSYGFCFLVRDRVYSACIFNTLFSPTSFPLCWKQICLYIRVKPLYGGEIVIK